LEGDDRQHALKEDARRHYASGIKARRKLKKSRHGSSLTFEVEGFGSDHEAPVVVRLRGGEIADITDSIPIAIGLLGIRYGKAGILGIGDPVAVEIRGCLGETCWDDEQHGGQDSRENPTADV
jgi:hypothetical protein